MNEADRRSDEARRRLEFLSVEETAALGERGVLLPDPGSVLVSPHVRLEEDVVLWPNVILQASSESRIAIGRGTNLFPGTRIVSSGGAVTIGTGAEIGEEGGFTIKAGPGDTIAIGNGAR